VTESGSCFGRDRCPLSLPDAPLSDGTVILRGWERRDLPAIVAASHDPYIPEVTTVPAVHSDAGGLAWLERQAQRLRERVGYPFAIADAQTDQALGFIGLWLRGGPAELGYWVVPAARGRGVAVRAVRLVSGWAFTTLGLARVRIQVEPANVASRRVALRAGFRQEGGIRQAEIAGRPRDVIVFSLSASDPAVSPGSTGA